MNIHQTISNDIKLKIREMLEIRDSVPESVLENVAVEVPKNRDFGDFSTNVAMVLAKPLSKSPREVADIIVPEISKLSFVANATIAGPGFINIKLKDEFIWNAVWAGSDAKDYTKSLRIDLDYGGYNIGKNLHIGHLRTTVVGDTFNRIAKHLGHYTKSYNHMGDWGRPMGLIIAWILEHGMPKTADDVNNMYPAASARAKQDPDWLEYAKKITAQLQLGNAEYNKIYDVFAPMSLSMIGGILKRLDILPFDENKGERLIADYVPLVQKILQDKGLLVADDGAQIIPVKTDDDTAPMPPVMWRSSAGAQTYAAADLTAVYYRDKTDNPNDIVYFTDSRQNLHFTQIFRAARLMGIDDVGLQHIGFGTITGADGKPFKTRDGGVPSLDEMLDMVAESVRARANASNKNLPDETIEMIALAALKFNDLMHDVRADYVFDVDAVTQFEGRTGPYILYTAVRLNSIIKKVGDAHTVNPGAVSLHNDERNLLMTLLDFNRVLDAAFTRRAPDMLANYTYDLCQGINTFYHNCPILRDDVDNETRAHRIEIVKKSIAILSLAINLMGLCVPESM